MPSRRGRQFAEFGIGSLILVMSGVAVFASELYVIGSTVGAIAQGGGLGGAVVGLFLAVTELGAFGLFNAVFLPLMSAYGIKLCAEREDGVHVPLVWPWLAGFATGVIVNLPLIFSAASIAAPQIGGAGVSPFAYVFFFLQPFVISAVQTVVANLTLSAPATGNALINLNQGALAVGVPMPLPLITADRPDGVGAIAPLIAGRF